jgi:hypothetical protein
VKAEWFILAASHSAIFYWNPCNVMLPMLFVSLDETKLLTPGGGFIERVMNTNTYNMLLIPHCGTTPMPRLSPLRNLRCMVHLEVDAGSWIWGIGSVEKVGATPSSDIGFSLREMLDASYAVRLSLKYRCPFYCPLSLHKKDSILGRASFVS